MAGPDTGEAARDAQESYSLTEVAAVLGLTRQAVSVRVKKGQLEAQKNGGTWRVSHQVLAAAVEAKRRKAMSLGSVRVLPVGQASGDAEALAQRMNALETVVGELRDEQRQAQARRDEEVAALEQTCARLQAALHQMVDLLGSTQLQIPR